MFPSRFGEIRSCCCLSALPGPAHHFVHLCCMMLNGMNVSEYRNVEQEPSYQAGLGTAVKQEKVDISRNHNV